MSVALSGTILSFGIAVGLAPGPGSCRADSAAVRIDHVTIAVDDLAEAASFFEGDLGFTLKPGTAHRNGLHNAHVRFADGSALELMAVEDGTPDALSEVYRSFLAVGQGGAFVALAAGPVDSVLVRLGGQLEGARVTRGPAVDWIAFPEGHDLHPVFFVDVRSRRPDRPDLLEHANRTAGLAGVSLQVRDPERLGRLLAPLGAEWCGRPGEVAHRARVLGLKNGALLLLPVGPGTSRGRIVGVTLKGGERPYAGRVRGVRLEWPGVR